MKALHIQLKPQKEDYVTLRYFLDNPNEHQPRSLHLKEIEDLIQIAERDYYTRLPEDFVKTGQRLYNWLDGSQRLLTKKMEECVSKVIVLAIATDELAHLPWEVLHDGTSFLVERRNPSVVPVRWLRQGNPPLEEPKNRTLQVLFMATSPLGVEPVLNFEAEEGEILKATEKQPLLLTVEESGCLTELGNLAQSYEEGYFDVLHLTGHATRTDEGAWFLTETETGECLRASAQQIAEGLGSRLPQIVFVSGCRTGEAGKAGAVPSMAEQLLREGAKAVLGWGRPVLDSNAIDAAAALYGALSKGDTLAEAVACTYQALIDKKAQDWHLLRLHACGKETVALPGMLVTPLKHPGRQNLLRRPAAEQFLDPEKRVKVPSRENFVGRRRQLQNCIRSLKPESEQIGVLIYGMGGLGKSSLAARLCDRFADYKRIVLVGSVDEPGLVQCLAKQLHDQSLRNILKDRNEDLEFRLLSVFQQLQQQSINLLIVLDDFEVNLEPRGDGFVLMPEASTVLLALVFAIRNEEIVINHRLILTCRYKFEFEWEHFYIQPLDALQGADLQKKCSSLAAFGSQSQVSEALRVQAMVLADGNPRLLELLNEKLLFEQAEQELNRLRDDHSDLRQQVLAKVLLNQIDQPLQQMLSLGLVFKLPVPKAAMAELCAQIPNLNYCIDRAITLGLLEASNADLQPKEVDLRVPRILPLKLPSNTEALYAQAAQILHRIWCQERKTATEEQKLEIHQLALQGKVKEVATKITIPLVEHWLYQSRFREVIQLCQATLKVVKDYRIFHQLAQSETELGEIEQALEHCQQALECFPSNDDKEAVIQKAAITYHYATIRASQGQLEEAKKLYQSSWEIQQRVRDDKLKAATLTGAAEIYAQQGQLKEAIKYYRQARKIQQRINHTQGEAAVLHQLAVIYTQRGQLKRALCLYQNSLEIKEQIGDTKGKATTLHQLAGIYVQQGKISEAINLYWYSLGIQERVGHLQGKAATLCQLAEIFALCEQVEKAIEYCKEALEIYRRIDDPKGEAGTLRQLATICVRQEQVEKAIEYCKRSYEIEQRINHLQGKATTLAILGRLLASEQRDFAKALAYLQKAQLMLKELGSPDAEIVERMIFEVQQRVGG